MRRRCKLAFIAALVISLCWLLFNLIHLPAIDYLDWRSVSPVLKHSKSYQSKTNEQATSKAKYNYVSVRPPEAPYFMKYFQQKTPNLNTLEVLLYDFDPNRCNTNASLLTSVQQHKRDIQQINEITNPLDQYVKDKGYHMFSFNLLASNRAGICRPIPDLRSSRCEARREQRQLGPVITLKASIIICYYNEAPSALLRTIYSVIKRSPLHLIEEIILIDDYSDLGYDEIHMRDFLTKYNITYMRTSKREGLIRARIIGARKAVGDVLIFLDSHVEANEDWLEPLLEVVQADKKTIASPIIDLINADELTYIAAAMVRGGMHWSLNFKWEPIPSNLLKTADDFAKPVETPTIAGGLYAINREYFKEIGEYDDQMELWGGENVELSMRVWMCGGRVLILPCSRLGHIFRKRRPYDPLDSKDTGLLNAHRAARVWLDEYLDAYYEADPRARNIINPSDVSDRIELKNRLNCKNFQWYLDNIYPAMLQARSTPVATSTQRNLFKVKPR